MTKLRWERAARYHPDPAAVTEVPELTRPQQWTAPEERKRKAAERAARDKELRARSEQRDWDLLMAPVLRGIRDKEDRGLPLEAWEKLTLQHSTK